MVDRINELAKISKQRKLTKEESEEQAILRNKFLRQFKKNFKKDLDNVYIKDEKGKITKYEKPSK